MKRDIDKRLAFRAAVRELRSEFEQQFNYLLHLSGERPFTAPPALTDKAKTTVELLFDKHWQEARKAVNKG